MSSPNLSESLSNPASPESERPLEVARDEFQRNFNQRPFMFGHHLSGHPLFTLPRLAVVAQRMLARGDLKKFVALGGKSTLQDATFSAMPPQERLAETVRRLSDSNVWMKITSADTADPEYDAVQQEVLDHLQELSGVPLRKEITWSSLTVFLASPNVVTPYHVDHESNFLFQIAGEKDISLFDPHDRDLVPHERLEKFYVGDYQAAQYRTEIQDRASVFRLAPGRVVHHPPLAPHWVKNGDNVSISVSIGFCMRPLDRRARVYQVNHYLRRVGLRPTPPGVSSWRDALKIGGVGLVSKSNASTPDEILFGALNRAREFGSRLRHPLRTSTSSH